MFLNTKNHAHSYPIDNINQTKIYWGKIESICEDEFYKDLYAYFKDHKDLLDHIFSISPFLSDNIIRDMDFYAENFHKNSTEILSLIMCDTQKLGTEIDQNTIMRALRINKRRMATLCGLMDINGKWGVMEITKHLSDFASTACHATLNHCLRGLAVENILTLNDCMDPASTSGFSILGMGKLGGDELNYSSDIDLIAFYDMDKIVCDDTDRFREKVVRTFKSFITIMEHVTADGYVFRTDFRLRPNPSMTPIIMSRTAMLQYYETMGLNWERSAMIKARPVAGDIETGNTFLADIKSFIWRKNLDFMALEDIYAIKNKINTHRSNFVLKLYAHNIKLGIGGIREIEFFVQSQQLIWGGRLTDLRSKKTLETLETLTRYEQVSPADGKTLKTAYLYLRKLEHRLQMIKDEQTHTLPECQEKMMSVVRFMGYDDLNTFSKETLHHLQSVAEVYTNLFKDKHIGQTKNSSTTADMDESYINFKNKDSVRNILSHWQSGEYRATRSEKSRALLVHLETDILRAFQQTENPEETLSLFDQFLGKLPAGVQLFSLFKSNPALLKLLANIMGNAPRLASKLVDMPHLLDGLITGYYKNNPADMNGLNASLQSGLNDAKDFQDVLETTRRFKAEQFFEQGIRLLENLSSPHDVSDGLTRVSDTVLQGLIPNTVLNMQYNSGTIPNGNFAIVALGKLGGGEMSHRSDVDLMLIYDHQDSEQKSTGKRALGASQYYTGLCQRIITAISSRTKNGVLFETDMRLRPHGNSGSLATGFNSFKAYYNDHAWTWEFLALTRARVIYASSDVLRRAIEDIICTTLQKVWDEDTLLSDVASMRRKLQDEFYDDTPWYIKHRQGGLIDVEFIAQTLQLQHAHKYPDILQTNTLQCYHKLLSHNIIDADTHAILTEALVLWHNIQGIIRLTTQDRFYEDRATAGQLTALLKCTGVDSIDALHKRMDSLTTQVRAIFNTILKTEI